MENLKETLLYSLTENFNVDMSIIRECLRTHINAGLDLLIEELSEPSSGFDQEENAMYSTCEVDRGSREFLG